MPTDFAIAVGLHPGGPVEEPEINMVKHHYRPTLILLSLFSGCTFTSVTPPSVDVLNVRLVEIGLVEQQLATTLCVTNPNTVELSFRHVTVDVDVSGLPLAVGTNDLNMRLPPLSSTTVLFTVVTTIRNFGPQVMHILRGGNLDYSVHGTVSLVGALTVTLPFSWTSDLDPVADGLAFVNPASNLIPSPCSISPLSMSVGGNQGHMATDRP